MTPEEREDRLSLLAYLAALPNDMPVMVFTPQSQAELAATLGYCERLAAARHPGAAGAGRTLVRMAAWAARIFDEAGPPLLRAATPSLRGDGPAPTREALARRLVDDLFPPRPDYWGAWNDVLETALARIGARAAEATSWSEESRDEGDRDGARVQGRISESLRSLRAEIEAFRVPAQAGAETHDEKAARLTAVALPDMEDAILRILESIGNYPIETIRTILANAEHRTAYDAMRARIYAEHLTDAELDYLIQFTTHPLAIDTGKKTEILFRTAAEAGRDYFAPLLAALASSEAAVFVAGSFDNSSDPSDPSDPSEAPPSIGAEIARRVMEGPAAPIEASLAAGEAAYPGFRARLAALCAEND